MISNIFFASLPASGMYQKMKDHVLPELKSLAFLVLIAEALLEQAMIGPSPNPLILSYLKYAISSQVIILPSTSPFQVHYRLMN